MMRAAIDFHKGEKHFYYNIQEEKNECSNRLCEANKNKKNIEIFFLSGISVGLANIM